MAVAAVAAVATVAAVAATRLATIVEDLRTEFPIRDRRKTGLSGCGDPSWVSPR